jgi:hypothetical protein
MYSILDSQNSHAGGLGDMTTIACGVCGATNRSDAVFCYSCGTKLFAAAQPPPKQRPAISQTLRTKQAKPHQVAPRIAFWIQSVIGAAVVLLVLMAGLAVLYQWKPEIFQNINFTFLTGTEETNTTRRVTQRETDRLSVAAQSFIQPDAAPQQAMPNPISVDDLVSRKSIPAGREVLVQGMLTRKTKVDNLLEKDWPLAAVLEMRGAEKSVLVIYRGDSSHLTLGNLVNVRGMYYSHEQVLHASRVQQLDVQPVFWVGSSLWLVRATLAAAIWMVFCTAVFLWRARRYQIWRASPVLAVIAVLLMISTSACTIHINTTIRSDGSGGVNTEITDTSENFNFFRQVPGLPGYMEALKNDFRSRGVLVTTGAYGSQESIDLQRNFRSLEELSQAGTARSSGDSWVSVEQFREGSELVYRFTALVDTRGFYKDLSGMDSNVRSYLTQQFDALDLRYSVYLPGNVVYTNVPSDSTTPASGQALGQAAGQATWKLRMNDLNQLVAEARAPARPVGAPLLPVQAVIVVGILVTFGASTLLLLIGLVRYHPLKRGTPK